VLFLDEVGALNAALQARLLKALETGLAGSAEDYPALAVHVRVLSATRRNREELLGRGGLRDDLFYALSTVEIVAPPLLGRGGDAVQLANHFLNLYAHRHNRPRKTLAPEAAHAIVQNPWIGDVRALRQAMERVVIFAEGDRYELCDLPLADSPESAPAEGSELKLSRSERTLIALALKRNGFNISHAAKQLGLSRAALYRRMAKHGL
jgi:DNA-binding NtrC family response regulator